MAAKKITFISVTKDVRKHKIGFKYYFPMVLLAIAFMLLFILGSHYSTSYGFLFLIPFILVFVPLFVAFSEYNAFLESGGRTDNFFKTIFVLFKTSFRTGRFRYFFSLKIVLLFFVYLLVGYFAFSLLSTFVLSIVSPTTFNAMYLAFIEMSNVEMVEDFYPLLEQFTTDFALYFEILDIGMHLIPVLGLIYLINRGVFQVYTSLFIEQRPFLPYHHVNKALFSDRATARAKRGANLLLFALLSFVYVATYVGLFYLFKHIAVNGLHALQASLLSMTILLLFLPFILRFNYFLYQKLVASKRKDVLLFVINELSELLKTPGLPGETQEYLRKVKMVRENELKTFDPPNENVNDEKEKAP